MASVGVLLETSHRTPNLDYDLLMRLTLRLTDDMEEVERLFRLMLFNVLAGNRDDHAKNFTFLHDNAFDSRTLSRAYDLTRNSGMNGEQPRWSTGKAPASRTMTCWQWSRRARAMLDEVEEVVRGALRKLG